MKFGGDGAKILAAAYSGGGLSALAEVEHILTQNDLWVINVPIYRAFMRLSAARGYTSNAMSNAIPIGLLPSEVRAYATANGFGSTKDEVAEFVFLIDKMEDEYMRHWREKAEAARARAKGAKK